jgi:hypothetical protein
MANPERGEVDLVTPTKTYTLEMTTNATCAMEKRTGKTFGQLLNGIVALDISALRSLTYTVLQAHHAREVPNEEAAGRVIDAAKVRTVRAALIELFNLNSPPEETPQEGRGAANPPDGGEADGTGDNSTLTSEVSG